MSEMTREKRTQVIGRMDPTDQALVREAETLLTTASWTREAIETCARKAYGRAMHWDADKKRGKRSGQEKNQASQASKIFLDLEKRLRDRLSGDSIPPKAPDPTPAESPIAIAEASVAPSALAAEDDPPHPETEALPSDQAAADDARASKLVSDTYPIEVWMTEDVEDARRLSHTADGLVRTDRTALFEKWREAVELFDAVGATPTNPHLGAPPPAAPETAGEDAVNDNAIAEHVTPDNDFTAAKPEADAQVPPALPTLRHGTPIFEPFVVPNPIEPAPLEAEPEPVGPPALDAAEQAEANALLNANTREWTRPQFRRARQLVWATAQMASGDQGETIACMRMRPGAEALRDRLISEETWRRDEMTTLADEDATRFFQGKIERQAAHLLGVNDPRHFRPEAEENGVNESQRLQQRWMMEDLIAKRSWTEADFAWARAHFDTLHKTHPRGEQLLRGKYRDLDKSRQATTVSLSPTPAAQPSQAVQPFSPIQPSDHKAQAATPKPSEPAQPPSPDGSERVVYPLSRRRALMAIGGMLLIAAVIGFVGIRYQDTFWSPPSDTAAPTPPPAPVTPPPVVQRPTLALPPTNALPPTPVVTPRPPVVAAQQPVLRPLRASDLGDRHINLERVPRYGRGAIPAQVRFRNIYCAEPPTSATDGRGRETLDFSQCSWREFPSPDRSTTSAPPNGIAPAVHGSKPERAPARRGTDTYLTV